MAKLVRPYSEYMDEILGERFNVLDHGYIIPVDYMGNEQAIVDAARVSYGEGTKTARDGTGLINYLLRHRHTSPIEQAELKIEIKAPIFVFRQLFRHRTASINEYSCRYSRIINDCYVPDNYRFQSIDNKQGSGSDHPESFELIRDLETLYGEDIKFYERLAGDGEEYGGVVNNGLDVAREMARMHMPVSNYSKAVWKIDTHNLLHLIGLRADSHAQYEIRVYAEVLLEILNGWMPTLYDAFMDYRVNAVNLSGKTWDVIQPVLQNHFSKDHLTHLLSNTGMSKGEIKEVVKKVFK